MHHIRRAVFLAALIAGSFAPLAAQEAGDWYLEKPIADVVFTGLVNVKAEDLMAVVKPYLGQPFSYELFERLQNAVVALDWFEQLEPVAQDPDGTKSAVVVEFQVTERPAASAIQVTGNSQVRTADILEKVLLKQGDLVSSSKLHSDEDAIRLLYLDKGYADVSVSSRSESGDTAGSVKVIFTVIEGAQTKIRQVLFSGNVWASESTLRSKMDTKPPSLFDSGVFQASKLEADKQKIVDYYADHGFLDAQVERVEKTVESVDGRNELVITVYVHEGDQYSYAGMTFEGNRVFPSSQLEALVSQRTGKAVSRQKLLDDFQRVVDLYTENGYIFNQIQRREVRDEAAKTVAYVVAITEYDKAHIERIIFKGNEKTSEEVLRRELPIAEGDVFNRAKIVDGYRALYNLQYFSNVTLDTPTGSAPGLIDLVFTVEESSTADINFGVMFSGGDYPISGTVKWNERNFRGNGQTLGVNLELSPVTQMASLNFYEPWVAGIRWSAGATLSVDHSTETNVLQDILAPVFSDDDEAIAAPDPYTTREEYLAALAAGETISDQYLMNYDSFEISLAFNTGYRMETEAGQLGVRGSISSRLRYIEYDPMLYRPFEGSVRDNLRALRIIDRISPTIYLDGRDYYLNPSNGWYLSQGIGFTGGLLFGSRHYIRTDTTLEGFVKLFSVPVFESWDWSIILAAHTSLSMILPQFRYDPDSGTWGWATVTDSTDLLYIDGMTVGRGWRQMYGEALWDNKIELRTPLAKDVLTGVLFFDAAALWSDPADMASIAIDNFRFSFGAGLRFTIPQFPIRLYLGKGFQVKDGAVEWKPGDLGTDPNWSLSFIISLGGDVF
ncbi:MAG: outer membrane protein assembly factor BamA [Spirochaetes bacterium]|nr:outer membrane protein assembly factor BamA [Spirochaetota bacterium]